MSLKTHYRTRARPPRALPRRTGADEPCFESERDTAASGVSFDETAIAEHRVPVHSMIDLVNARQHGRELALNLGFSAAEIALIAAAISEIARNMVDHAGGGELELSEARRDGARGLEIVARDHGPGIADVAQAMRFGYSSRQGLGLGLPGAKWLMDDFEISTRVGEGTTITMRKWRKASGPDGTDASASGDPAQPELD